MNRTAPAPPGLLLAWMDALTDPTRLRLLRLLDRHELGVVDLCDILQKPQSTVSRHLQVLVDQGWVRSHRQGTTHLYRMILDELQPPPRKFWLLVRQQIESWATAHQDELRLTRRLAQRQHDAQAFFAGAAGQWDRLRQSLYGDSFTTAALLALLPSTAIVADLGCGTGQVAAQLAGYVAAVHAIDNSPAMLKAAQHRLAGFDNVTVHRADLTAVPLDDGACDAAMLLLVLAYVADPTVVLRESARILKPGGRLIIADLLPHDREDFQRQLEQQHRGFAPKDLSATLAGAGLRDVAIHPLPPEPAATGPALFLCTATR